MSPESHAKQLIKTAEGKARNIISVAEKKAKYVTQEQHEEVVAEIRNYSCLLDKYVKSFHEASATQVKENHLLNQKLDSFITEDREWKIKDKEWKINATPVIKMGQQTITTSKTMLYLSIFVVSLWGAVVLVKDFIMGVFKK